MGVGRNTLSYWYAAASKPFLKVPTVTASATEATCRHLYKYKNYTNYTRNRICNTDILLDFYPGSHAIKVKHHYHNHLLNLIAILQCMNWDVFLFHLKCPPIMGYKNFRLNSDFGMFSFAYFAFNSK